MYMYIVYLYVELYIYMYLVSRRLYVYALSEAGGAVSWLIPRVNATRCLVAHFTMPRLRYCDVGREEAEWSRPQCHSNKSSHVRQTAEEIVVGLLQNSTRMTIIWSMQANSRGDYGAYLNWQ